ncbi:serine/threonine protein kinase [Blautia sp. MSJ-19]|uniref:serine/threonine protein kinase n=1 Tax=Blautia sp. MSJ-19 TaxID=2841517 RepID=UPI001C0ED431|nr:serine/threonine-protein kinase [Blautia sp. MSJ-19]MBU5479981.1 serine/threonine protein kinase [Blautia sp. MSJ-19]
MLKGRYCIVEQIGKGGEGAMYLARDLELGIFRAVKELPVQNRREASLLRLLNHPSLPQMIDYAERGEHCYIIMEYIRGKSLAQYLQEGRSFSLEEILQLSDVILEVLEYLHSRKPAVFYGDLKPANLMLTEQNRLYLVDFGSASQDYSASYKETKGTREYAAPEQFQGKISAASDFYALGKTIEMLCGKKKIQYLLRCPAAVGFVLKCCRTEPEKRWKDAAEARKALCKIHPIKFKIRAVLFPAAAVAAALAVVFSMGVLRKRTLPALPQVLTPVLSEYYTLEYRYGMRAHREKIYANIETRLQRLQKVYQDEEEQIRILELLAINGELADRADRAELYYRQLLTYESGYAEGYLKYGMFLCRQARYQESRAVYRQWKKRTEEVGGQEEVSLSWQMWKKEAGIILGKSKTAFME